MKILYFTDSLQGFSLQKDAHNGSGWVGSLLERLKETSEVSLAVCGEGKGEWGQIQDEITLFPIDTFCSFKNRLKRKVNIDNEEKLLLPGMLRAIHDFKPDVIHIWGTEYPYGTVCCHTDIPCILHIQGILTPYCNAKFPPGFHKSQFWKAEWLHLSRIYRILSFEHVMRKRAEREIRILKACPNFLGRTAWDKSIAALYNPDARYFYDSEMLRTPFMQEAKSWKVQQNKKKTLVSVISMPYYKGHDLILKTAKLLSEHYESEFTWKVFGVYSMKFWEKNLKISASGGHVELCGTVSAEKLKNELLDADVFIQPSYIDNSPNSLCEAQLLGLPVIATAVGGIPSLIKDNENGFLVAANDPFMMAERIIQILKNPVLAESLGKTAGVSAAERHDPETIINDLLSAYRKILRTQ